MEQTIRFQNNCLFLCETERGDLILFPIKTIHNIKRKLKICKHFIQEVFSNKNIDNTFIDNLVAKLFAYDKNNETTKFHADAFIDIDVKINADLMDLYSLYTSFVMEIFFETNLVLLVIGRRVIVNRLGEFDISNDRPISQSLTRLISSWIQKFAKLRSTFHPILC